MEEGSDGGPGYCGTSAQCPALEGDDEGGGAHPGGAGAPDPDDDDGGGARLGGAGAHDGDEDALVIVLFLIGLFQHHRFIVPRYHFK